MYAAVTTGRMEKLKMIAETFDWYIVGTCWMRCDVVSNVLGLAIVRLKTTGETVTGRARRGIYGVLVEPKEIK